MRTQTAIVAVAAVLAAFLFVAVSVPFSLLYGPADEVTAARDLEISKMAIAILGPTRLAAAVAAAFTFIAVRLRQPGAPPHAPVCSCAVLLC